MHVAFMYMYFLFLFFVVVYCFCVKLHSQLSSATVVCLYVVECESLCFVCLFVCVFVVHFIYLSSCIYMMQSLFPDIGIF